MATPSYEGAEVTTIVYGFLTDESGIGDLSPFASKVLTFLKMTKTDYKYVSFPEHMLLGSPKGKMPWIYAPTILGDTNIADSSIIIKALADAVPAKFDLDAHLSIQEKAIGWAMKTMVEESLYFSILHVRWNTDETSTVTIPMYLRDYHWSIQKILGVSVGRGQQARLQGQGTGKLSDEEITAKANAELEALSDFLGDKRYFMGDRVSSYDATMFGFLVGTIKGKWNHPICQSCRDHKNLVEYVDRMIDEFWS